MCLSIYLSIYLINLILSIYLSVCLSVYLSNYIYIHISICIISLSVWHISHHSTFLRMSWCSSHITQELASGTRWAHTRSGQKWLGDRGEKWNDSMGGGCPGCPGCPGCGRNATVSTQRLWPMVWWRMVKVSPVQVLFLPSLSESLWIVANRCLVPPFRALNRLWLGGHAWVSGTSLCSVDVVLPHFC